MFALLGHMRKIEESMEMKRHASHDYDVCALAKQHACLLACMHTFFCVPKSNLISHKASLFLRCLLRQIFGIIIVTCGSTRPEVSDIGPPLTSLFSGSTK